ncbi:MAG: ABC transporter permease [Gammaproteobacteria bacterium]
MVVLWTDALIYMLLTALLALAVWLRDHEPLRRPWRTVCASRTAMASLAILLFFVAIGLLDSVHFRDRRSQTNEIISLLDAWAAPLRAHTEKTYSAPFAAFLYNKEQMPGPGGEILWDYPRLQFGAAHLRDPAAQKGRDITVKGLAGSVKGLGLWMAAGMCVWLLRRFLPPVAARFRGEKAKQRAALDSWQREIRELVGGRTTVVVWAVLLLLSVLSCTLIEWAGYYHVLGTDKVGEDVFYQSLKSIRTGLVIGTLTTLIMLPMAILFGILAGFFRGWVDDVIQYLYTTLNSIPSVLLIAASILMVQVYMANHEENFTSLLLRADMRLLFLCLILGVTSWTGLCRLLRAETLKLREMEYVQAAQALGVRRRVILARHILPNVMHIVLISVVLDFSSLVLAEAVLSYINIGVDPTTYSWGNMINSARLEMAREPLVWWSLGAAFVFMFALVLSANLFADSVRDAFDPRRAEHG